MRCFIAIDFPENVKSKIFHEFETLYNKGFCKGKLVKKENLHLTLKFLGNLTEEQIEETRTKLRDVDFEKFSCQIGRPGFFESEDFIKIIWVGLECEKIYELQKQISEAFPEFKDNHDFSTHITIARVNSVRDKERLVEYTKKINFKNLNFDVENFYLIKSELTARGPIYRVIEEFKLKK